MQWATRRDVGAAAGCRGRPKCTRQLLLCTLHSALLPIHLIKDLRLTQNAVNLFYLSIHLTAKPLLLPSLITMPCFTRSSIILFLCRKIYLICRVFIFNFSAFSNLGTYIYHLLNSLYVESVEIILVKLISLRFSINKTQAIHFSKKTNNTNYTTSKNVTHTYHL